jgi:nucleoside-diphosphate-sugar epimerase
MGATIKRILITGVNGFVGRACAAHFMRRKVSRVIGLDLQPAFSMAPDDGRNIDYIQLNASDPAACACLDSLDRIDAIIHLAGLLSKEETAENRTALISANVHATHLMLEQAAKWKSFFVFPSTAMVYGDREGPFDESMETAPPNSYALTKRMAEEMIRWWGRRFSLAYAIFRPSIIYGPGQRGRMFIPSLCHALSAGERFPMTPGDQKRDLLYIDDLLAALEAAIDLQSVGIYNVGGGAPVTLRAVAAGAESLAGVSELVDFGAIPYREHEIWDYSLDIAKANAALDWNPKVSITEGLKRTLAWFSKEMKAEDT